VDAGAVACELGARGEHMPVRCDVEAQKRTWASRVLHCTRTTHQSVGCTWS
jgi:hypothetical protein